MVLDRGRMPDRMGSHNLQGRQDTGQVVGITRISGEMWENARSFLGVYPPVGSVEIGRKEAGGTVYIFYQDKLGDYWYTTERTLKIEKELAEAQKKRRAPRNRL